MSPPASEKIPPYRFYLLSPIPYEFLHQRPQKLADAFSAQGIAATYVGQTAGWREYLTGRRKELVRNLLSSVRYHLIALRALAFGWSRQIPNRRRAPTRPGLEIIELPLVVPTNRFNSPLLEKLNAAVYRAALRRNVLPGPGAMERSAAIVENPFFGRVLEKGDFDRIAYDCIDVITLYSGHADRDRFLQYEKRLIELSDLVFVTSRTLENRLREIGTTKQMIRISNGVDVDWFEKRLAEASPPEDVDSIEGPRIGYVGTLYEWFDFDLLLAAARELPATSFVLVGPLERQERSMQLTSLPNLHWLGRKPYGDIPLYISTFDVCLVPFKMGPIAEHTNPIKVFEYFALGKPVVSTPLTELQPFAGVVSISGSKEEFIEAIRQALKENSPAKRRERKKIALQHSWKTLASRMAEALRT